MPTAPGKREAPALLAVTTGGARLAFRLAGLFPGAQVYLAGSAAEGPIAALPAGVLLFATAREAMAAAWPCHRQQVFIMAAGAAVRLIAPYIRDKRYDPAVVVLDETGRFAVSLLSGHLGGANLLAEQIAGLLGSEAVITTASDRLGQPALDLLARRWRLSPEPWENLKKVQSLILEGSRPALYAEDRWLQAGLRLAAEMGLPSPLPMAKGLPPRPGSLYLTGQLLLGMAPASLCLRPLCLYAGLGCKKGIPGEAVLTALQEALALAGLSPAGLTSLHTAWLKEQEEGLRQAAVALNLPLCLHSREELEVKIREAGLQLSQAVNKKIGVGAVCEPAALLGAGQGSRLILGKFIRQGVTIALAEGNWP